MQKIRQVIPWMMAAGRERMYGRSAPQQSPSSPRNVAVRRTAWMAGAAFVLLGLTATSTAHAQTRRAIYYGGTAALPANTAGTFDTTLADALQFHYRRPDGTAGEIAMKYETIRGIEPRQESRYHLGVLPLIAVSLVAQPLQRYMVTINYADANGVAQVAIFQLSHRDQQVLGAVVNARSPRNVQRPSFALPSGAGPAASMGRER